jgi:hypothetical protein
VRESDVQRQASSPEGAPTPAGDEKPEESKVKYMAKVIFGDRGKRRKCYYMPQAKSAISSWYLRKTLESINTNVIQEFTAPRLAKIINPEIVPDAKLGQVTEDGNRSRLFLMTEFAGQKTGESFQNFGDADSHSIAKISEEMWKTSFAISVGLLNDRDINKENNIGVVSKEDENRLCLFDLGHPTPDKFKLDKKTLLTKSTSVLVDVLLWLINFFL